jgi:hypothetical protein
MVQRVPGAIGRGETRHIPSRPRSQVCAGLLVLPWTTVASPRIILRGDALRLRSLGSGEMVIAGSIETGS